MSLAEATSFKVCGDAIALREGILITENRSWVKCFPHLARNTDQHPAAVLWPLHATILRCQCSPPQPSIAVHACGSLVPRPSAASFIFAYVTFEPLSISWQLIDKGSKVTYANINEAADGLGTRLRLWFCVSRKRWVGSS